MSARTQVAFVAIEKNPPVDDPGLLAVVASTDRLQRGGEAGLRFTLTVSNRSGRRLDVHNPYESVSYQVTDGPGWPVTIAQPTRTAKIHRPNRSASKKSTYLTVERAIVDEESLAADESAEAESFMLKPGASIVLDLVIPQVLDEYEATTAGPPAPGTYHVTVLMPLSWQDGSQRGSVILRSESAMDITVAEPAGG